jgi:hypothetical protein
VYSVFSCSRCIFSIRKVNLPRLASARPLVRSRFIRTLALTLVLLGLVSTAKAVERQKLKDAISAPNSLSQFVDSAIGGARQPEVIASTFVSALKRFHAVDRTKYNKRYRSMVSRITTALSGQTLKPSSMAKGFQSHRLLLGKMDGATLRLRQKGAFSEPLEGGEDLSVAFNAIGTILAAAVIDDLSRKRVTQAKEYARNLFQLARLVSTSSRTLGELEASLTMIRKGLPLLGLIAIKTKPPASAEAERLRLIGLDLAPTTKRMATIRQAMREPQHLPFWLHIAKNQPALLWKHVALDALALIARTKDGGPEARKALKDLSRRNDRIGIAAAVRLARLR